MRRWILRTLAVLIAVAAGAWLWTWSQPERPGRGLAGGPLFDAAAADVVSLEIRRPTGASTLERRGDGWVLTGQVDDPFVDPDRAQAVLTALMTGEGQPVLPGTEPDARRFGFGGPASLELALRLRGGGRERLALGDASEVAGMIYASGAGRPGVFGIGGGLYARLARLPDSVRLARVLPPVRAADLDSLRLGRRGGATWLFAPDEHQRWWLRRPGGTASLVGDAARYHGQYQDRRRDDGGVVWLLADERRLREVVYRASDTAVAGFPAPGEITGPVLADAGLQPPYRTLTLHRTGGDPWRLELGEEQQAAHNTVMVRRETALVVARGPALRPLEGPLSDFLDLGALSFRPGAADSFRVDGADRPVIVAQRAADPQARRDELESIWDAVAPPGWELVFGPVAARNQASDLQITLDRLEARRILPPASEDPLAATPRWRLRAWLPDGRAPEVWFGRLAADQRPAVWDPADGKVIVVPEEILVTLRNLQQGLRRR